MPSVLFVCTANICRSPIASALFQARLDQKGEGQGWRVESAGTWALEEEPAAEKSVMLLGERGLDLRTHRSRSVTRELLRRFDLILTMERGHKEALQAEFPEVAPRTFLITEMVGENQDIKDPMGGSLADFTYTINELEDILERGYERICQLVHDPELRL
jgi:protein-tyrosine-phosphatase